jgi:DNA-binding transcriptional LysR family regulator
MGSMTSAAQRLGVTQPAVSKVIAELENTLHVRLLDRGPRGIEPTMYGQALFKRSLVAFDELKLSVSDIAFLADPTAGELRIGCSEGLAATVLPPILHSFSRKYPGAVISVGDVPPPFRDVSTLRGRGCELLLGWLENRLAHGDLEDDLNVEILFEDHLVLAAGRQTGWARRRKIDLAELVNEPWILPAANTWNYACVVGAFQSRGLDLPKITLTAQSWLLRTYFLGQGDYIAAFAASALRAGAGRFGLKDLPVALPRNPAFMSIVTLKNRTLSPLAERLVQHIREVTGKLHAHQPASGR